MTLLPFLAALAAPVVEAASYTEATSVENLAERSDRVIVGEVISTSTGPTKRGIETVALIEVHETMRGAHSTFAEVRVPGGSYGGVELHVSGAPRLIEGDEILLFLSEGRITGLGQGALIVSGDTAWRPGRLGAFAAPINYREWLAELPADGDYEAWHLDDIRAAVLED